jgi:hypothetical protein
MVLPRLVCWVGVRAAAMGVATTRAGMWDGHRASLPGPAAAPAAVGVEGACVVAQRGGGRGRR